MLLEYFKSAFTRNYELSCALSIVWHPYGGCLEKNSARRQVVKEEDCVCRIHRFICNLLLCER